MIIKQLLVLLLVLWAATLHAQRLYLQDVFNGNFYSYSLGDDIEVMLFNSSDIVKGKIVGLTSSGFYLNDTLKLVHLSEVASVVITRRSGFARVVSGVVGGTLLFFGSLYVIGGVLLVGEEPTAGVGIACIGALVGTGGYLLINKVTNKKNAVVVKAVDNQLYHLFIE